MSALVTTNLYVNQGADFSQQWAYGSQDPTTGDFVPMDLTGWTSFCQFRDEAQNLLQDNVPITLGGTTGTITLSIDAETSWGYDWDNAVVTYDLLLTDTTCTPVRFAQGGVFLSPGVSHH